MRKSSFFTRAAIGTASVAVACAALGPAQAFASQAKGPSIDTYASWDGATYVQPFSCPETTNYGQTITMPKKKHHITKATFAWTDLGAGSFVVRAEVYAWDAAAHHATGDELGTSGAVTVQSGHSGFFDQTFKIKTSKLKPGQQYVVFATLDLDYDQCTGYSIGWGAIANDSVYPGGTFVFLNSDGDASQWTTTSWVDSFGYDSAMKIYMKK